MVQHNALRTVSTVSSCNQRHVGSFYKERSFSSAYVGMRSDVKTLFLVPNVQFVRRLDRSVRKARHVSAEKAAKLRLLCNFIHHF